MSLSDNVYIINLNNTISYIYKYILPVLYIVGNVGNLLSILILSKKGWRKNVCVFYFKFCLLLNSVGLNCTLLGSIFILGYNINLQNSNVLLCKIFYYVPFVFATLLPTVLILASIDRLLISSQNVDTRLYSSKRLAYFSISISTIFWIVYNFHILVKVNLQEIYPSYFVCYYDLSKLYLNFVSYSVAIINCLLCLLMIILSIFGLKNVRRIRAIPRQQRNGIRAMTKKDFQLLRCLFAQDIVFIIFSCLVNVFYVYTVITKDYIQTPLEQAISDFFNNLFSAFYYIIYCDNFFIFVVVSKAFRHELKRWIYKRFGKDLTLLRDEDNKQENIERDHVELNVVVAVSTIVLPV